MILKEEKWFPGEIIISIDKYINIFVNGNLSMGTVIYGSSCYRKP